ncbi:MAG: glycosyltransferase family 2 protein [Acidimicrobiia bacterium]|nr:glycosyltransferase family 2 protein [Acidimicrobiia bacterium]MBV9040257.1 glycosyltransferase family 2 protein [Acidimicrobiia bacterium]
MADRPRVSAVVVNYNARDHLLDCIRSLRADGIDEIVLVDNASTDGSVEAVHRIDPDVVIVPTGGNLGFGSAANRGLAVARGRYVTVLNPDAVVEGGTIKALAEALDADPGLGAVAPRVDNPDGTLYPSVRAFPSMGDAVGHAFLGFVAPRNRFSRRYRMLDWDHAHASDVDWASGTCLMLRADALGEDARFDESYFMYVEDVDLCWRLRQAGWRVGYEPAARVVHTVGASSELAPYRMIAAHHRSLLRFSARTAQGRRRALLPLVAAGLAVRTVLAWLQRASRGRPHAAP